MVMVATPPLLTLDATVAGATASSRLSAQRRARYAIPKKKEKLRTADDVAIEVTWIVSQ